MTNSKKTVWVKNPHGVKVALPKWRAEERVNKTPGYTYCEPEVVPKVKQYPMEGELTPQGETRRAHRQERANEAAEVVKEEAVVTEAVTASDAAKEAMVDRPLTEEEWSALDWVDLKKYAVSRGIEVTSTTKKDAIVAELKKTEGV